MWVEGSASLEAGKLTAAAGKTEKALGNGDGNGAAEVLARTLPILEDELAAALAALKELTPNSREHPGTGSNQSDESPARISLTLEQQRALQELRELVVVGSFKARKRFAALQNELGSQLPIEPLAELDSALQQLDYAGALTIMDRITADCSPDRSPGS